MVRLKAELAALQVELGIRFQFQNGAIKRKNRLGLSNGRRLFQFQNGAIKRLRGYTLNYGDI